MPWRSNLTMCAALFLALELPGAAQQYSFRHYGAAEGLQNLAVLSLAQDGAGYLWAGTEGGLYRYDGTRFHLIAGPEGLPCSTEVHTLFTAADGALWANTCSRIFRFDGRHFHPVAGIEGMSSTAETIADDSNGQVLIAASTGLYRTVPDGRGAYLARLYPLPPNIAGQPVRAVARFGSRLWFSCGRRVYRLEGGRVAAFGPAEGLPEDAWDAITETPDKCLWVRSPSRLYRKSPQAAALLSEQPRFTSNVYWGALAAGRDGSVMVATDQGVAIRREGDWRLVGEQHGLRSSLTSAVLEDREGSLWIGLVGGGIARWLGYGNWEAWTRAQGLPSNVIWTIRRDRRGSLWVGTSLGLARLNESGLLRTWTRREGLGGDNIRSVAETSDGAIWVVPKPGKVTRIGPDGNTIRLFGPADGLTCDTSHRDFVDHLGRLWVATACGIFRNDHPSVTNRFYRIDQPPSLERTAWAFAEDRQGVVWITNPEGLWRLGEGGWRQYRKADGILTDAPYIPVVAPDGTLWLHNRFDAGIEKLEFSGDRLVRATSVVPIQPLSVEVTAFHGFDAFGRLWRGTADGVSVLAGDSWNFLSAEDGLIWNDTDGEAFWADSGGDVWVGTSGGLAHYRPLRGGLPVVRIADPAITALQIDWKARVVRAEFSSLSFKAEQLVHFAYRLDGGRWIDTNERVLSIAGLAPGHHRLEIRSRVRNGPFSRKVAEADFEFAPKWWEDWWFRAAGLLLVMAAGWGAILWRHRRLLGQRTAELESERVRMREEKKSADAAIEAKERFLANMSHEIRTPLNGVIGLSMELEAMPVPPEALEVIRMIRSSSDALLRVLTDVLDFSKVEAGKLELEMTPFDLHSSLADCVSLFRAAAAEKGLRLACELAPGVPAWVAGDDARLRQVLLNLVSNAVKFTRSGEVVVTAAVERQDSTSSWIAIEVRDTGIGIARDQLPKLFSSFHQADASISRRYGGTGLGLAISKRLVELMGGTIEVDSEPGVGTRFRLRVRLGRAEQPVSRRPSPGPVANAANLRILVVEDNPVNQRVLLKLLEKLGAPAELATGGAEAIQAVIDHAYDLVLMDVQMPDVDGISATREIRKRLPEERQPTIIGVTAHATEEYRDVCLSAGMEGYLTKPVSREKLQALLEDWAGRRPSAAVPSPLT